MRGRPLRFLVMVVAGWSGARIALLWPEVVEPIAAVVAVEPALAQSTAPTPATPLADVPASPTLAARTSDAPVRRSATIPAPARPRLRALSLAAPSRAAVTAPGSVAATMAMAAFSPAPRPVSPPGLPTPAPAAGRSRWSGSAWAIVRGGGGGVALLSPLLGGSQAGVRIAYALDHEGKAAVFARAAAPFRHGPIELAAGAQVRPTRLPITFYAEARASDGRVSPAAGLFGGATAQVAGFRLDGYGQAGVIVRDGVSGFADGQLRATRRIGPVDAGVGTWAAAQRGATRVDAGPSISVPIAIKPVTMRIALDWRHRIAGNARPASGPVLSLGADF